MSLILTKIYRDLGIANCHIEKCKLPRFDQAPLNTLEIVDIDFDGRPFVLERETAEYWRKMCESAANDVVLLAPYSGFRSYLHQRQLIARKLAHGQPLEVILTETAIPGFSEHHTGRAIDICADGEYKLEQDFENTLAFSWLRQNASRFGFRLSYPRDNDLGIVYEPWHWFFAK